MEDDGRSVLKCLLEGICWVVPLPVAVTTRIITFLVGNPYKPSFVTVTGWGVHRRYMFACWNVPSNLMAFLCWPSKASWQTRKTSGPSRLETLETEMAMEALQFKEIHLQWVQFPTIHFILLKGTWSILLGHDIAWSSGIWRRRWQRARNP